jgi:hypothetical protein
MFGTKPEHRIPKGQHGPHRGEGLVSVSLDVLLECEGAIKEEPQVAPRGARPERGSPCVGGVAKCCKLSLQCIDMVIIHAGLGGVSEIFGKGWWWRRGSLCGNCG